MKNENFVAIPLLILRKPSKIQIHEKYENKTFPRWNVHKIRFSVRSSRAKLLLVNVSLHYCSRFMCHPAPVQSFFVVYVNVSFMTIY